ncbi:MAG: type IX secretion system membrane protein PorP/SprF [Flavobacteriales bacterium]
MKKGIYIIVFILVAGKVSGQLFPQQSLYFNNPLPLNAGAAGKDDALSISLSHRTMWRGVEGAPKTQYVCIHTPLKNEQFSVGLQLINDQLGITKRTGLFATGAYRIKLSKDYRLSFGLTGGMQTFSNRWSEIETTVQGDQAFAIADQTYWLPQIGTGIFLDGKNAFAGISVPRMLTETYQGGGKYKAIHTINNYSTHIMGGYRIMLKNHWYISPSALLKYHPSSAIQTDLTCMLGKKELGEAGLTYRFNQSVVGLVQARINAQLNLGYGFDYLLGGLSQYQNGSHEIMMAYKFIYQNKAPNPRLF